VKATSIVGQIVELSLPAIVRHQHIHREDIVEQFWCKTTYILSVRNADT